MTADELKKYVTAEKRICPMPLIWNEFLEILDIKDSMPPNLIPLILNGWFASDLSKRNRLLAQIDYASKNKDCFEKLEKFILNIDKKDWLYGEEPPSDKEHSMI